MGAQGSDEILRSDVDGTGLRSEMEEDVMDV